MSSDPLVREFLLAFWKIHILHHAEEQGVYGQWMLEELHHHGYRLSPGTLYPLLARMARRGWLRSTEPKKLRDARVYRITPAGAEVLNRLRDLLAELQREVGQSPSRAARSRVAASGARRAASSALASRAGRPASRSRSRHIDEE
jgi:PadR family transcriptional regulator, regulatory protein PadR